MARSTMEVAFLGTQMTQVDDTKYAKVFYGDEPDGKTEHGLSIIGMAIAEDAADEVFAAGAQFAPLELVRITFDVARGGQNKGKNLALHIEAVNPKGQAAKPAAPQGTQQQPKPTGTQPDPAKA
ncbi:hypothetical protein [Ectopseudomonas mendocina]|jgi:hypothetical protein|uniref:hypothetical protein n=1 Tax=Ectopseudomonas mendocina TaxID=300 RepID=UPI0023DC65D9|nr:hypothetical protein [Pseudomonas mendocina]MDF2074118.1 hypothetical protein [Pseudomonas mendocina]